MVGWDAQGTRDAWPSRMPTSSSQTSPTPSPSESVDGFQVPGQLSRQSRNESPSLSGSSSTPGGPAGWVPQLSMKAVPPGVPAQSTGIPSQRQAVVQASRPVAGSPSSKGLRAMPDLQERPHSRMALHTGTVGRPGVVPRVRIAVIAWCSRKVVATRTPGNPAGIRMQSQLELPHVIPVSGMSIIAGGSETERVPAQQQSINCLVHSHAVVQTSSPVPGSPSSQGEPGMATPPSTPQTIERLSLAVAVRCQRWLPVPGCSVARSSDKGRTSDHTLTIDGSPRAIARGRPDVVPVPGSPSSQGVLEARASCNTCAIDEPDRRNCTMYQVSSPWYPASPSSGVFRAMRSHPEHQHSRMAEGLRYSCRTRPRHHSLREGIAIVAARPGQGGAPGTLHSRQGA